MFIIRVTECYLLIVEWISEGTNQHDENMEKTIEAWFPRFQLFTARQHSLLCRALY